MLKALVFIVFLNACQASEYFYAKNTKIYDANDNQFLIRGINSANADWDSYNRNYAFDSIPAIARTGANTIRIQWRINLAQGLSVDYLDKIIQEAINNKLVPIIQLHDATGSKDRFELDNCANWYKNNVWLLNKYKRYLIVNIANEWSPYGTAATEWRDAYKNAIRIIRSSGWNGLLIVDASAYAQNSDVIISNGVEVLNSDPVKNIAFSIHMYAEWKANGGRNVGNALWDIQQKGLTVIVGEFAQSHPDGCQWVDIDCWEIMRQCKWKNVGYLGWSWLGNGKGDCNIDLAPLNIAKGDAFNSFYWKQNDYTKWGNDLIYYTEFGIKDTSVKASIFL